MSRYFRTIAMAAIVSGMAGTSAEAQIPAKTQTTDPLASARQAVSAAESGRCAEALPVLTHSLRRLQDKAFRYRAAFATARCAMSLNDMAAAADALSLLRRDFPDDPEALYISARYFAQLGERSAQDLAERFPNSPQVGKLNAEALESKQMWKEAIEAYRKVLAQDPRMPGIHFRIAGILLDTSSSAEAAADARRELEAEIEINPDNAAAVFAMGEIARRVGAWDEAIQHFSRAAKLDVGFLEAYLALGLSLNAAGRHAEAISPLERYVKGVPENPAGHYQLALAYSRTGNKEGADRELQLQREAAAKAGARRSPNMRVP
jgi:predicted Zn-dependent protease